MKYIQLSWECKHSVLQRAYFAEMLIDLIAGYVIADFQHLLYQMVLVWFYLWGVMMR